MPPSTDPSRSAGERPAWGVWLLHALGLVLVQGAANSVMFMLPVLARREFDATPAQTTLITAAPSVLAVLSIFWGVLIPRASVGRYLMVFWAVSGGGLLLGAVADSFWTLAAIAAMNALAWAAWWPIAGHLLRLFYSDAVRGRAYAALTVAATLVTAAGTWGIGLWLDHDPKAFKVYLPIAAGMQLVGCIILALAARGRHEVNARVERAQGEPRPSLGTTLRRFAEPVLHMREILRADRVFARYEAAFMTYGIGWMVGWALLPLLVTDGLKLPYDAIANSAHVPGMIATVIITPLAGWLIDRKGAVRTCAASFAVYAFWPLGLLVALLTNSQTNLVAASVIFGVAGALTNMGWMLGPVALAPTPEKASQYVAIHSTLVGVRGGLFQFLGVGLYLLTGGFTVPLIVAAMGFAWASWQMVALHRIMRSRDTNTPRPGAGEPSPTRPAPTPGTEPAERAEAKAA